MVPSYLPELASSGFADATVRHLLDMTTGIDYIEDYADENSSVWQFSRAGLLPAAAAWLPGARVVPRVSPNAREGLAARRALCLQDGEYRRRSVGAAAA